MWNYTNNVHHLIDKKGKIIKYSSEKNLSNYISQYTEHLHFTEGRVEAPGNEVANSSLKSIRTRARFGVPWCQTHTCSPILHWPFCLILISRIIPICCKQTVIFFFLFQDLGRYDLNPPVPSTNYDSCSNGKFLSWVLKIWKEPVFKNEKKSLLHWAWLMTCFWRR